MFIKILKRDILRNKTTTMAIFIFTIISTLLIVIGSKMFLTLDSSIENLFAKSLIPHFAQYHSGDIDKDQIKRWVSKNEEIKKYQLQKLLNINSSDIQFNKKSNIEETVMEILLVKQNLQFDFLLNLENEIIKLDAGEIAVPIYYMQRENLELGDTISIEAGEETYNLRVAAFIRDAQMNPAIVSSKRFLISDTDFESIAKNIDDIEYQISFRLKDAEKIGEFSKKYLSSSLPQKGPSIDYNLLKILNSISDGLISTVIVLISLLINIITLLSLHFLITLTLEEDYESIGIMKAIGIPIQEVKNIYVIKYLFVIFGGNLMGYIVSIFVEKLFFKNINLYIGESLDDFRINLIALIISIIVNCIIFIYCILVVKKSNSLSVMDLLRISKIRTRNSKLRKLELNKVKFLNTNIFLGIKDILLKAKQYLLIFIVFSISVFIINIPQNFLYTISSPNFISYMGLAKSDMIFSLRQSEESKIEFNSIIDMLNSDNLINDFKPTITSKYDIINNEGYTENIFIETGSTSKFPATFLEGDTPQLSNEIAISYLIARDLEKSVGDNLDVVIEDSVQSFLVSGIYQDITNGGKTAKADIRANPETISWYTINVNSNIDKLDELKNKYESEFDNLKVYKTQEYFKETFAYTIQQLDFLTKISAILVIAIVLLITSLFLKVTIAKDSEEIVIKKSIGISSRDIKVEYQFKILTIFYLAILFGLIITNILGEDIFSLLLSIFGAPKINLERDGFYTFFITPFLLMTLVTLITFINLRNIEKLGFRKINRE